MVQEENGNEALCKAFVAALALAVCIGGYIAVSKIRSGTGGDPEETGQTELTIGAFDADIEKSNMITAERHIDFAVRTEMGEYRRPRYAH